MYLGVDLGTTNVKAVVVDSNGRIASVGTASVERFQVSEGGVEQDIEQIWQAVQIATRKALQIGAASSIKAIGISSQGGALQVLDGNEKPLGHVVSWMDTRGRPFDALMNAKLGVEFFASRLGFAGSRITIGQILRLRKESPALLQRPNRIGFVGDIIVGRLCGRRAHDPTSLSIAMLYNPWLKMVDADVMAHLDIQEEQLPCLLPATIAAGPLDTDVAQLFGLTRGIPVSPAVHDQYAASLGVGSVAEGEVMFGAGTAWVLLANTKTLLPPAISNAFVCSHVIDGMFGQMVSISDGGAAIHWAAHLLGREFALPTAIDAALEATSPGAEGLRFWPYLSKCPCIDGIGPMKGRLNGITLKHGPIHVIRAVIEGLACELHRHLRLLRNAGVSVKRLVMCGNAANGHIPQIISDVVQLPIMCADVPDASALGAAMIAGGLAAPNATLHEISRQWTPSRRIITPRRSMKAYDELRKDYFSIFAK